MGRADLGPLKGVPDMLKFKIIGLALALVLIAGLVAVASGATGAYFSNTEAGEITGTIGSIDVTTSGGTGADGLTFAWDNMLPGFDYTATATYQNTGSSVQDVWLVFPNRTALSALCALGAFGEVTITSTNGAYFYSNNLNDHPVDQGGTVPPRGTVKMVPQKILLAQNVGPTGNGTMTFTFAYASKKTTSEPGGVFNLYPRPDEGGPYGGYPTNDGSMPGFAQYYIDAADGSGNGLPFQIVATQHGIEPGDLGAFAGF
jgi:hypothetical protein